MWYIIWKACENFNTETLKHFPNTFDNFACCFFRCGDYNLIICKWLLTANALQSHCCNFVQCFNGHLKCRKAANFRFSTKLNVNTTGKAEHESFGNCTRMLV